MNEFFQKSARWIVVLMILAMLVTSYAYFFI